MKTFLIAAGAVALATPALAQMASPTPSTPPASSAPSTSMPPAADAGAMTAAPAAAPSDPKAIIATEFPTYDKDGSGSLSKGEFDSWLTALKDKSGTPMKPAEKTSWLKGAFTTADKDKDKAVSLAELTDYLTAQG